jgi:valyl-tRNA synthetase
MSANIPSLPTQYDPFSTEDKWQKYWEENQVFQADPNQEGESFSLVIPPPNVTGNLHMGHAFEAALMDVLVRYHRMLGYNTLCLPGTDHASIATQTIIERQLKAEGKTRADLGREKFLERAWKWKEESGGQIVNQLRRIGLSADWSRERFTMDEGLSKAVLEAFVRLYDEGLIYRGNYMVNWCPATQSAVSDLEVEPQEVNGHLWHFRYPLTDGDGYVEVATTRPETMLGDTGVAVNPNDERYQNLIGKTLTLPIMNREIPIVADELVDPEFGTGCVKVTPAHDPNDFTMGQRHDLPMINIMNKDGTLNENAGEFAGQDRYEARKNVVKRLEEEEFLVKIEEYSHSVPYSDRGKVPVEPLISTQWFVKIEPLSQKALHFLDEQQSPHFVPQRWSKVYRDWLVKLKDWCISRQLWWGHQIPAWYAVSETNGEITDSTPFVVAHNEAEAKQKATAQFGEDVKLQQDPDVLDTWFSSGLWPFSTLGWPDQTPDLAKYYPTSTLVTGFDIIFFWVARMTIMAGYFTDQMPFQDVYIHGLVRDENGKKMSKSAGNGIDPLILIQKYGADALRYTLIKEVAGAGQDISLQYDRNTDESPSVEASRNFANKLWNAARFVMLNLEGKTPQDLGEPNTEGLELADRWILSRFYQTVQATRDYVDNYGMGEAAKGLYDFIWGDFCDWYIELVKTRLRQDETSKSRLVAQQTLAYVLDGTLKLLHPFMPHITEEIWQTLTQNPGEVLALQTYPQVNEILKGEVKPLQPAPAIEVQPAPETATVEPKQVNQFIQILGNLPRQVSTVLREYRRPLTVVGVLAALLVGAKVTVTVLNAINQIPLVPQTFKSVGLGYSVWFTIRYLITAPKREELGDLINNLRRKVIGAQETIKEKDAQREVLVETEAVHPESPATESLVNPELETEFDLLINTIRTIRNLRAEAGVKPSVQIPVILQSENPQERLIVNAGQTYIQDLAKVDELKITPQLEEEYKQTLAGVTGTVQVLIPLSGLVDIDELRAKLEKNLGKVEGEIKSLTGRLNNQGFVNKAPAEVVQGARDSLAEAQKQADILKERLARL